MKNLSQGAPHVQSVERAMQLLELLGKENREMALTEIATAMAWPKSTVHGLLATMRDHQFVDQSPTTGRYRLGVRLFELGNLVARSWDIRAAALPFMQHLNRLSGEMVHLATEDKGEVLYLEKLDSTHMMRIVSEIGTRLPMHCSGLGKVLLAYKTPPEVKWILAKRGMQGMTNRTITDPQRLEKELCVIRKQGYATDDGEIMDSLRCIAAPIRGSDGKVEYAISVSGLSTNMQGEHFDKVLAAVLQAAENISIAMGFRQEQHPLAL